MRPSILLWSTISGTIIGLIVDALLVGAVVSIGAVFPGAMDRLQSRWFGIAAVLLLAAIPITLSVLGYLEGELKAV